MATVINNSREPIMLEDGTVIGAAHTPEARREGVRLSETDQKRYGSRLTVIADAPRREQPAEKVAPAEGADSKSERRVK